ncbi:MAG TPA: FAD/NAD(P)-binding protein [Pseudonocardia sp.]|nr:FAD/NAD(P)-binding protein [Pseudonocardia sp.]
MTGDLEPMLPVPYRVAERTVETADSVTLRMTPVGEPLRSFLPGQFTMLCVPGVGEIAISISGDPSIGDGVLVQTIRDVGAVSRALHRARPGQVLGARGPFGTSWDLESAECRDLLIVAGGVGLAPLRPVLLGALARRAAFGRIVLVAGARAPEEFLFRDQLARWSAMADLEVAITVDRPARGWSGLVGFVTEPLARLALDPDRTTAFVCGPETMMRLSANVLLAKGMSAHDIRVSLERDMKCGIGLCGHCQLGPLLICRDGPVLDYARTQPLLAVSEL